LPFTQFTQFTHFTQGQQTLKDGDWLALLWARGKLNSCPVLVIVSLVLGCLKRIM